MSSASRPGRANLALVVNLASRLSQANLVSLPSLANPANRLGHLHSAQPMHPAPAEPRATPPAGLAVRSPPYSAESEGLSDEASSVGRVTQASRLQIVRVEGLDEVQQFLLLVDVQLGVDALRVRADGVFRHHQFLSDACHAVAARNELHDLCLARR